MKPDEQNIVRFKMMPWGFDEALEHLLEAVQRRNSSGVVRPLYESLNSAVALDDRIGTHSAPEGKALEMMWRNRVPKAAVMAGVRFARNRVHHQWADALLLVDGIPVPMLFPIPASCPTARNAAGRMSTASDCRASPLTPPWSRSSRHRKRLASETREPCG